MVDIYPTHSGSWFSCSYDAIPAPTANLQIQKASDTNTEHLAKSVCSIPAPTRCLDVHDVMLCAKERVEPIVRGSLLGSVFALVDRLCSPVLVDSRFFGFWSVTESPNCSIVRYFASIQWSSRLALAISSQKMLNDWWLTSNDDVYMVEAMELQF